VANLKAAVDLQAYVIMSKRCGYTLAEVMVMVALLSIVLVIGVPGFYQLMRNNRTTVAANDFVTALNLARSEAVKRAAVVRVSACDDGGQCDDEGSDWARGWTVWVDSADGTADTLDVDESLDERLKVFAALKGNASLTGSASRVNFSSDGSADAAHCFELRLPDAHSWRRIQVNLAGAIQVERDRECGGG
jgi:type IV fimbrial biogenesis protein FimT